MALIICPGCRKKISSVTSMCPICGFHRGEMSEEQLLEFRRRQLRDRIYRLKMTSYGVMTLFVGAYGWYWWESSDFQVLPSPGPVAVVALGAVAYLVVRVLMFRARRKQRELMR